MKNSTLTLTIILLFSGFGSWIYAQQQWTPYTGNPILTPERGSWDAGTISAPMVVMFKDTLRMWYEGSSEYGFNGKMHIGYAWSADGIHWNSPLDRPVILAGDEDKHLILPRVIVDGDSLRMWFGSGDVLTSGKMNIQYAVSADGMNWVRYPDPVITPGGSWYPDGVLPGGVIKENGIFKMWFSGGVSHYGYPTTELSWNIGYATSPDGIHWTLSGEPVLLHGSLDDFDPNLAGCSTVIKSGSGYQMWYLGWRSGTSTTPPMGKIGYAFSRDGLEWEKYEGNPVLSADSATSTFGDAFLEPCVVYDGEHYRMWFAAWHGATPSIGYSVSVGGKR